MEKGCRSKSRASPAGGKSSFSPNALGEIRLSTFGVKEKGQNQLASEKLFFS